MYSIGYTNQFKKSLKRCVKRGLDVSLNGVLKGAFSEYSHNRKPPALSRIVFLRNIILI